MKHQPRANRRRVIGVLSRSALACGACLTVLALASNAAAQGAPRREPAASSVDLGEVIVTTQRRSERLRDVPISVSAQTGEQLENAGIKGMQELELVTPALKIDRIGNFLQPAIRGISSTLSGPGSDAPVALYLDGVIQPNQIVNNFDFADLERIEVAKGPQGTLFGRNATGGAISIFTKAPTFTPTGDFAVGYGNRDRLEAQGFVAGPLVGDVLAGSLSAYYLRHDSYDYDIARNIRPKGYRSQVYRGKLLFRPTDWAKVTLIASYQDRFDSDAATGVAPLKNTFAHLDPTAIIATEPHTISFDTDSFLKVKSRSFTVLGEFEVGDYGTLKTTSAYARSDVYIIFDADRAATGPNGLYSDVAFPQPDTFFSHEISFASNKVGPLSYVVGAYYYYDDNRFAALRVRSSKTSHASDFSFISHNPAIAYAGFAEVNYDLTDRLTVIAGIRYSWERRANKGSLSIGPAEPVGTGIPGPVLKFHSWTPRFSVRYRVADDTNVYFTYSQGFKSGGIGSTSFFTGAAPYLPEKVKAYEVGVKSAPMPSLSLDAAAYYYDYSNLQVQVQRTIGTGSIINAASARIYGFDANATWRATPELTFSGGLSLLDAKYDKFPGGEVNRPRPPVPGIGLVGNVTTFVDLSGNTMTRAPKYSFSLTTDYRREFEAGTFGANLTFYYSGTVFFDSDERIHQGPYGVLNGKLSWQPRGTNFRAEVWGKNLANRTYVGSSLVQATNDQVGYAPPRTFGVTLNYGF